LDHWSRVLEGKSGTLASSSFFAFWPWGKQFCSAIPKATMCHLTIGPNQQGQPIMGWNLQNHELKSTFSLYQ
jgi:hypothetical protein